MPTGRGKKGLVISFENGPALDLAIDAQGGVEDDAPPPHLREQARHHAVVAIGEGGGIDRRARLIACRAALMDLIGEVAGVRDHVRVGGSDADWQPSFSNYQAYREYAWGDGWKVWVAIPGNPAVQQAPLKPAFDLPTYQKPEHITIPDDWLE